MDAAAGEYLYRSVESLCKKEVLNLLRLGISILRFLVGGIHSGHSVAVHINQHPVPSENLLVVGSVLRLEDYLVLLISAVALRLDGIHHEVSVVFLGVRLDCLYEDIWVGEVSRCCLVSTDEPYLHQRIVRLKYIPPCQNGLFVYLLHGYL